MLQRLIVVLFFLAMPVSCAFAQENEVGFVVGGTFSPDSAATVVLPGVGVCAITFPNCGVIRSSVRIDTKIGFEGAYGRRILNARAASLYVELPVLGVPDRQVQVPPRRVGALFAGSFKALDFSSIFLTPSLKVKLLPEAPIAPFVSVGGGMAHFSSGTLGLSSTSNTTGAFQIGGGVDIKTPLPHLGFRAEVREFWAGQPKFDFGSKLDHHQNLFAGGGIVFHF